MAALHASETNSSFNEHLIEKARNNPKIRKKLKTIKKKLQKKIKDWDASLKQVELSLKKANKRHYNNVKKNVTFHTNSINDLKEQIAEINYFLEE